MEAFEMEPITLAILSDLHVGTGARAKDLCPYPDTNAVDKDYRETFLRFLRNNDIRADYLIVPGDVSNRAQPQEFALASDVVTEIATSLHVPLDRIAFVPGNHDADWSVISNYPEEPTGFRLAQRYDPLRFNQWVFDQLMRQGSRHLLEAPHFVTWEYDDLVVIGYNSSWHDNPRSRVHHGMIPQESVDALREHFSRLDLTPTRLRVFLVHHHPVQYSDPIPDDPDFSVMTNAGNLLRLLHDFRFDLLIHGHKHCPNFSTQQIDGAFPLTILCSGSFSAQLDLRWVGMVNNQFHLLRIQGRDADDHVYGMLESWTYLSGRGWVPSDIRNGIQHRRPFGTYITPKALRRRVLPIIRAKLQRRDYTDRSYAVAPKVKRGAAR